MSGGRVVARFNMVPRRVARDPALGIAEIRLLMLLIEYSNDISGWAFPSSARLVADLGYSEKSGRVTVNRAIRALVAGRYIRYRSGSGRATSRYQVIYDLPEPPKGYRGGEDSPFTDQNGEAVKKYAPEAAEKYASEAAKKTARNYTQGNESRTSVRGSTHSPSLNQDLGVVFVGSDEPLSSHEDRESLAPTPQASAREGGVRTDGSGVQAKGPGTPQRGLDAIVARHQGDFTDWWALYPRKLAKADALKAYAQAIQKGARPAVMYAGLARQLPGMLKADPKYLPFPATWLRGARWEDLPDQEPKPPMTGGLV